MKKSGLVVTLATFVLLIAVGFFLINGINGRTQASETALVESSVRSAALTCYAVEGAYPAELDYLKKHYGLYYDESIYTVRYDAFASNVFPDIFVMERSMQ